jgi:hypothetical protein
MQRGHIWTGLRLLQPCALTRLPKHNILNKYIEVFLASKSSAWLWRGAVRWVCGDVDIYLFLLIFEAK